MSALVKRIHLPLYDYDEQPRILTKREKPQTAPLKSKHTRKRNFRKQK